MFVTALHRRNNHQGGGDDLITNGLIFHLPMDEGTGTVAADASDNDNDADLLDLSWVAGQGSTGYAIEFPHGLGDYLDVDSGLNALIEDPITLTFWVNLADTTSQAVFINRLAADGTEGIYVWVYGATIRVRGSGGTRVTSTTTYATGTWIHVAVTFNGTTGSIFKNGVADGSDTIETVVESTYTKCRIGQTMSGAAYPLDAVLDDFRIYSRILTGTEISAIAAGTG